MTSSSSSAKRFRTLVWKKRFGASRTSERSSRRASKTWRTAVSCSAGAKCSNDLGSSRRLVAVRPALRRAVRGRLS